MKAYLVGYSSGSFEDVCWRDIFVTFDAMKAKDWCSKFDKRLDYWKEVVEPITKSESEMERLSDFYSTRGWQIEDCNGSFMQEIDFRK